MGFSLIQLPKFGLMQQITQGNNVWFRRTFTYIPTWPRRFQQA
jgi:hypothetical protein